MLDRGWGKLENLEVKGLFLLTFSGGTGGVCDFAKLNRSGLREIV